MQGFIQVERKVTYQERSLGDPSVFIARKTNEGKKDIRNEAVTKNTIKTLSLLIFVLVFLAASPISTALLTINMKIGRASKRANNT